MEKIKTLWQLRHSIVHTGGTLTLADAQKVKSLKTSGGKNIAFEKQFIFEVARKFHPIIEKATKGLGDKFKERLSPNIEKEDMEKINNFFEVKSSIHVWLTNEK